LNGGCMTIEDLAEFHLLPVGAKPRRDQDEFLDIRFIYHSIESRSLQESELYFVSAHCPVPLIDELRPSRSSNPLRPIQHSDIIPEPVRHKRPRIGPESSPPSDVPPFPESPHRSEITRLPVETYTSRATTSTIWTPERPTRPLESFVPGVPRRFQDPIPLRGRHFFSTQDDYAIIDYVIENSQRPGMSPNGQNLWKKAEMEGRFPGRTWQSLEGRYKKHIRPRWDDFIANRNQ
jgi:hypothetical protein